MKKQVFIFKLFINALMKDGNLVRADNTFARTLKRLKFHLKFDPFLSAKKSIERVKPIFEIKLRKVAATKYKIPYLLKMGRDYIFAAHFLLNNARNRTDRSRDQRLSKEFFDAMRLKGGAVKQKKKLYNDVSLSRMHIRFMQ